MADYNQTRSFNLGIAQEVSVEAALIYDDLAYAQARVGEGEWFHRSYESLMARLPYSEQTLRRHIEKLVKAGWVRKQVMKISGTPVQHFQIGRFLSTKLADSKKLPNWQNDNKEDTTNTTKPAASTVSVGAAPPDSATPPSQKYRELLNKVLEIVNPMEKPTDDRIRLVKARLKDYSAEEIIAAAYALSQSEWHRENKQMSVDNLLRPSKFGRWFAQATETGGAIAATRARVTVENQDEMVMRRMGSPSAAH